MDNWVTANRDIFPNPCEKFQSNIQSRKREIAVIDNLHSASLNSHHNNLLSQTQLYQNVRDNLFFMMEKTGISPLHLALATRTRETCNINSVLVRRNEAKIKDILSNYQANLDSYFVYRIASYFHCDFDSFVRSKLNHLELNRSGVLLSDTLLSAEEFHNKVSNIMQTASEMDQSLLVLSCKMKSSLSSIFNKNIRLHDFYSLSAHLNKDMHAVITLQPEALQQTPPLFTSRSVINPREINGSNPSPAADPVNKKDESDDMILNNIAAMKKLHGINTAGLDEIFSIIDHYSTGKTLGEIFVSVSFNHPIIKSLSHVGKASIEYNLSGRLTNKVDALLLTDPIAAADLLQAISWLTILELIAIYHEKFSAWVAARIDSRIEQIKYGFGLLQAVKQEILKKSGILSSQSTEDFFKNELNIKESDNKNGLRYLKDGNRLLREKKFQAAIEDFNKAIALLPDTKFVYFQRSLANEALNRHQQALDDFNTYWENFPNDSSAHATHDRLRESLEQRPHTGLSTVMRFFHAVTIPTMPAEPKPAASKPAELKPAAPKPAEPNPAAPKPAALKPAAPKPAASAAKKAIVPVKPKPTVTSIPKLISPILPTSSKRSNLGMETMRNIQKRDEEREKQRKMEAKKKEENLKKQKDSTAKHLEKRKTLLAISSREKEPNKNKKPSSSGLGNTGGLTLTYSGWDFENKRYMCGLYRSTSSGGSVLVRTVSCPSFLK